MENIGEKIMNKFFQMAVDSAREGIEQGQTPFGACIEKDGKIISVAHNTVWRETDVTCHAEINAIRKACEKLGTIDLTGCEIYSTTEPCPMCFGAIYWSGIGKIHFGTKIEDAQAYGFNELPVKNTLLKKYAPKIRIYSGSEYVKASKELFELWKNKNGKAY